MKSICILVQNVYDVDARVRRKAEALVSAGYSVDVLALAGTQAKQVYTFNGVNVNTLSLGKKRGSLARYIYEYAAFFIWTFIRVLLLTRQRRYVLIDVNTLPDFLIFAALPGRWLGAKLVLDMHEITPEFYMSKYGVSADSWLIRFLKYVEKISFDFADHVITISEPIQELLIQRGLDPSKSVVVMNAADEARFASSTSQQGRGRSDTFVMMYHGTLTRIYGLDIAIEAFNLARREMPGSELWILGSGTEQDVLGSLVRERGLSTEVKLLGSVSPAEIPNWLRKCDVGILPIRRDAFLDFAFPNKLPEFIIMGKPVLMSRLKTIRHYFSEEALAYFEPNNPKDLAEQMIRMYRDRELHARLAAKAEEEYAPIRWDVMKERYLRMIESIVGPSHDIAAGSPIPEEETRQDKPHTDASARLTV